MGGTSIRRDKEARERWKREREGRGQFDERAERVWGRMCRAGVRSACGAEREGCTKEKARAKGAGVCERRDACESGAQGGGAEHDVFRALTSP